MELTDNSRLWYTDDTGNTAASNVDRGRKTFRPRKTSMSRYEIASLIRALEANFARMGGASA